MELEITPPPSEEELEALTIALERLVAEPEADALPAAYRSGWRKAGLEEAVGQSAGYATARPRRTRGANRA